MTEHPSASGTEPPEKIAGEPLEAEPDRPPFFDSTVYFEADRLGQSLAERLQATLASAVSATQAWAAGALVQPVQVRAAEPSPIASARLDLGEAGAKLGARLETHLLVADGALRIWIAGADRLAPGATVTVVTIDTEGETAQASVTVADPAAPIELRIECGAPEAFALGVSELSPG